MTQATDKSLRRDKRGRRRAFNWVAMLSAIAALTSASAAMITAGNGIWHPPIPIPAVKINVGWVGPTPVSPQAAASPTPASPATDATSPVGNLAASPSPAQSGLGAAVATPVGPSTVADLGHQVTMWISSFVPGTAINFDIANRGSNPFVLDFDVTDVAVYDDESPPRTYTIAGASGNHQTVGPGPEPCQCAEISVSGAPTSVARHWTVNFKAISGRSDVTIVYTLA